MCVRLYASVYMYVKIILKRMGHFKRLIILYQCQPLLAAYIMWGCSVHINILLLLNNRVLNLMPYTYKFSRDVIFVDYPNLGSPQFYFRGSLVITPCASSVLQLFYNKLPAKTAKFTSLKNLYVYGIMKCLKRD